MGMSAATTIVHIDGAARGNPGPAAFAYIIDRPGLPRITDKGCLGEKTNNVAEYSALLRALERAVKEGLQRLMIHSDSELLVKQMNGEYRVKNKDLQALHEQASHLRRQFDSVEFRHVPRAQNAEADRLCNEALDGRSAPRSAAISTRSANARLQAARQEVLECLRQAAAAWSGGRRIDPAVELVLDQLWSILEENSLIRK
jgi:ribonuclease HI